MKKLKEIKEDLLFWRAKIEHKLYLSIYRFKGFFNKYKVYFGITVLVILIAISIYLLPIFQELIEERFANNEKIEDLKVVLISIGGALVGAGAISFSLVMFALQINIERMPYVLFDRFSSDRRIIIAFTSIIFLSIGIVSLSLLIAISNVSLIIITTFWAIIVIILLVIYAYRRTLVLINPIKQLKKLLMKQELNLSFGKKELIELRDSFMLLMT